MIIRRKRINNKTMNAKYICICTRALTKELAFQSRWCHFSETARRSYAAHTQDPALLHFNACPAPFQRVDAVSNTHYGGLEKLVSSTFWNKASVAASKDAVASSRQSSLGCLSSTRARQTCEGLNRMMGHAACAHSRAAFHQGSSLLQKLRQ